MVFFQKLEFFVFFLYFSKMGSCSELRFFCVEISASIVLMHCLQCKTPQLSGPSHFGNNQDKTLKMPIFQERKFLSVFSFQNASFKLLNNPLG